MLTILLHEIFHAPFRFLLGFSFEDGKYLHKFPCNENLRHFSEFMSDVGALYVLNAKNIVLKKDIELFYKKTLYIDIHRKVMLFIFRIFWETGFKRLCQIFAPLFQIYKKLSFLLAERKRIDKMTSKKLRGILVKKYNYTSKVKGMDKKKLKDEVHKRFFSRMRTLLKSLEAFDLQKLLDQEIEKEKNIEKKKDLMAIKGLFGEKMNVHWRELLWQKQMN